MLVRAAHGFQLTNLSLAPTTAAATGNGTANYSGPGSLDDGLRGHRDVAEGKHTLNFGGSDGAG